jgi:hypothetical protein
MKHSPVSIFLILAFSLSLLAPAPAQSSDPQPALRRVTLYKHGVGYFERRGKVSGDEQITFAFDAAQMNDVLKSLVVLDLNQGQIAGVTFDAVKPLEKRLEEFAVSLDGTNTAGLTALLGQLKGARVEVKSSTASGTGTIVGIERRVKPSGQERSAAPELVLMSEGGELRSLPLEHIRGIKLLDDRLRDDLERYLGILQSTTRKNARHLTITARGQGERELFISYIVEAPVWKTTYRVVLDGQGQPLLQGWAIVDNAQDEDWTNVSLSLVAGLPVSFIQDLQQPRYKRRPVVGMPEDYALTPQTHEASLSRSEDRPSSLIGGSTLEGTVIDPTGAAIAGATVRVTDTRSGSEITASTNQRGDYAVRGLTLGTYQVRVEAPGFNPLVVSRVSLTSDRKMLGQLTLGVGGVSEPVTVSSEELQAETEGNLLGSLKATAGVEVGTQEIGELFEYRIAHPVTIKRHSSAMIPIVQSAITGESVSLYNAQTLQPHPMSALYLTNTTGLTLEAGPMTIIENDTYAGEALSGRIKPGEKRLVTYAVDLGCRVSVKEEEEDHSAFMTQIVHGELRLHSRQTKTTIYRLHNITPRAKTVYLEHPITSDEKWQLTQPPEPVETTEHFRRFKVQAAPNATTQFPVQEELPAVETYRISNLTTDQIALFVRNRYLSPEMKRALEGVLDLKAQLAALGRQLQEKQQAINSVAKDQERMRENLRALGQSAEERQLVARYVAKLSQGEDQLERLRREEAQLTEQRQNLQRQLDNQLRQLALEHRLGR